MGISDTIKNMFGRAKHTAGEHPDQTKSVIDKGANKINDMTGDKMSGNVDKGANMAKDQVDKYGKQN
jgi:hypothetical protein